MGEVCFDRAATIRVFGTPVALRASNDALLQRMLDVSPPLWRPSTARRVARTYELRASGDVDEALAAYAADVKMFIAERSPQRVFVHAGVVAFDDRAIVIPGKSFSGKTTLVRALLDAGATYYSDEYAVLDRRGRVHPYPQPLGVRTEDKRRQIATAVSSRIGTRPIPIALVVLTEHRAGSKWRATRLSPARAVLEVSQHTLPFMRDPARSLDVLSAALAPATTLRGTRGDASDAVRAILRLRKAFAR